MIASFGNRAAQEIWETGRSRIVPAQIWIRTKALLTIMHATTSLADLRIKGQPPSIRLHKLKGDRGRRWSVTVELPWCITFRFKDGEFGDVRVENYHRG